VNFIDINGIKKYNFFNFVQSISGMFKKYVLNLIYLAIILLKKAVFFDRIRIVDILTN